MKTLVVYSSRTGNTRKLALAIGEALGAPVMDIEENPNIEEYDNIILGYWGRRGRADDLADSFIHTIENKRVGVFATVGAYPDSPGGQRVINYGVEALKDKGNKVLASFVCHGRLDPAVTARAKERAKTDPSAWTEEKRIRHEIASHHPNEEDIQEAKRIFSIFAD